MRRPFWSNRPSCLGNCQDIALTSRRNIALTIDQYFCQLLRLTVVTSSDEITTVSRNSWQKY